ncbi:putative DNA methyltransferase [Mycobacteroides abscessus subsp. massiliense]|nr:putative DNA methyltransferase [Mycobacteroides abscessus subsp. massiliense]
MITPYYQDDSVTLHRGDCLEIMADMGDRSVDIVVTSPPYNMGLVPGGNGRGMYQPGASNKAGRFREGYGAHTDAMDQDAYDDWQREVLAQCWRVARHAVFYNHRPRVEHGVLRDPLGNDFGIPLRQRIIWNRGTGIDVNLRNFCTRGEYIYLFAKPEFQLVSHSASGMGDVWTLGIETKMPDHPAPFPVSLPTRCIEATGATSVLDPFCGSGTTLRAAANLGITGIGIELEERYCRTAVRRLDQMALDFQVDA